MKILVVISSKLYIRNYISTKAFQCLSNHSLSYLFLSGLEKSFDIDNLKETEIFTYESGKFNNLRVWSFDFCNQLKMYEKSKCNKNFLHRLRRELIPKIYSLIVVPNKILLEYNHPLLRKFQLNENSNFFLIIDSIFVVSSSTV